MLMGRGLGVLRSVCEQDLRLSAASNSSTGFLLVPLTVHVVKSTVVANEDDPESG